MTARMMLVAAGYLLGTIGTLIGAGGGFILVPMLLLLYPADSPEVITSISLAVVFFNAASGSVAYARMGRVDYRSGLWFAAATVPGAIAGALTTDYIPRRAFNLVFGIILLAAAGWLVLKEKSHGGRGPEKKRGGVTRRITERDGKEHHFSYDMRLGMGLSLVVGYVSSLLGIGGGIIHVPALARLLYFPVHVATATSHFILAIMALTGTLVHVLAGSFTGDSVARTLLLGAGVVVGAQTGARLSGRIHGRWIILCLAVALGLVGVRIIGLAMIP